MVKHKGKRRLTRAQKMAETKRLKEAGKVFLEFHDNTSWAHDKIASGTAPLTPEAVLFMKQEIARRKDVEDHKKALDIELLAIDRAAKEAAIREAEAT